MPELPEVETVRRGLLPVLTERRIIGLIVFRDRAARRQAGGPAELAATVVGGRVGEVARRGKYLWLQLADSPAEALVAHLGMSGQFRVARSADLPAAPAYRGQERVRLVLDDGHSVSFVDQRTFGWLLADSLGPDQAGDRVVPVSVGHVAPDPFEPAYEPARAAQRLRQRRTGVKRALLDQTLVSGIGNIYADEALWAARLHPDRATDTLSQRSAVAVLDAAAEVMSAALASGGTSFDPLYVNVNGESGWFERDLAVYGRTGLPCRRCSAPVVRESFTNRSSHRCPRCQRRPVAAHRRAA